MWHSILTVYSDILSGIYSDSFFGIFASYSIWHLLWNLRGIHFGILFWQSILPSYLECFLARSGIYFGLTWHGHCRASTASARSHWLGLSSGSSHWDLVLEVQVRQPKICSKDEVVVGYSRYIPLSRFHVMSIQGTVPYSINLLSNLGSVSCVISYTHDAAVRTGTGGHGRLLTPLSAPGECVGVEGPLGLEFPNQIRFMIWTKIAAHYFILLHVYLFIDLSNYVCINLSISRQIRDHPENPALAKTIL